MSSSVGDLHGMSKKKKKKKKKKGSRYVKNVIWVMNEQRGRVYF
jgi:hypothetical protein